MTLPLQPQKSGLFSIGATPPLYNENDLNSDEPKLGDDKIIFSNVLDSLFAKTNQADNTTKDTIPFLTKKDTDTKSDENNLLLNSMFFPSFFLQNSIQTNNDFFSLQPKESFSIPANNIMKIDLIPINNFSLGEYKFYPIYPDNLDMPKNIQQEIPDEKSLQNLLKYDAVNLQLLKNDVVPNKNIIENNKEPLQDLQKDDLFLLKPIENKTNINSFPIPSKMNIEISNIDIDKTKLDDNISNKNYLNILEQGNPKQQIINFGENFFGYPISQRDSNNSLNTSYYLFKKENNPEGEKQIFIGVLSKEDIGTQLLSEPTTDKNKRINPLIIGYQEDKPKANKIMTLGDLKYNIDNLLNSYLKNDEEEPLHNFDNGISRKSLKSFFANQEKQIFSSNGEDRGIFDKDFKNDNIKLQSESLKNIDNSLKDKNIQNTSAIKFENMPKDKKTLEFFKNGMNNQLNIEKPKLETMRNKDIKEDTFFSFMSSQSENDNKENQKGVEEKTPHEGKGVIFEKGISTQSAPIIVSDKSTADYSNSMISTATRRAVDLSNQLQARGGGTAKIQIQDDKLGSIELNIHMKKDNTVAMEIKASDKDLKNILEQNSNTLKKSLDIQNISLTDFKVSTVEKSIQTGMNGSTGQGFSQQHSQHNSQNSNFNSPDLSQQVLTQGFLPNHFTNGSNQFFKNPDEDFSFNKHNSQSYINKNISFRNTEKNSITNIQRGANGSIKVLV